jgi:hypothetical protein
MKLRLVLAFCLPLFLTNCNPSLFDLQSAKMVGAGKLEISAYTVGLNIGIGLTDQIDLNASLTNNGNINDNLALNILTIAPKFRINPDNIAFYFPVSQFVIDKVTMFQPTMLFTSSLTKDIDFTLAPKLIITKNDYLDINALFGLSGNFSLNIPKTPVSIRAGFGGVWSHQSINNQRLFIDANVGLIFNLDY